MIVAPSTLAMTIYNLLALHGGRTIGGEEGLLELAKEVGFDCSESELRIVLTLLLKLKYITASKDGDRQSFDVRDPERRIAVSRTRLNDGWDGWVVRGRSGRKLLDEVIRGIQ